MIKFNCLVVDDEPIARQIIETYCSHLLNLQVVASCGNALEAKTILQSQKIDILFLDINMPVLDGISFFKILKVPPQVIFTTAYKEHATDAFDLAACDYLLKPFSLDRFMIAVDKAVERIQPLPATVSQVANIPFLENYIFVKAEGKIFKVFYYDLLYAEAQGNYTKIVTSQNTLLPVMTFSNLEDQLPSTEFIKIHRSFIINKGKIDHIEGNRVFINHTEIPIGNNYRESFIKQLGL